MPQRWARVLAASLVCAAGAVPARVPSPFDGCHHVYVDVGTNIGTQIRKLFEPERYPAAAIERIFAQYFGSSPEGRRRSVCAVGWEPNPVHAERLRALADRYSELGWRTVINLGVAASTSEGETSFFVDVTEQGRRHNEWSASLHKTSLNQGRKQNATSVTVRTVDLAHWLRKEVMRRRLPEAREPQAGGLPPHVVMKLDIEGAEFAVMPHLMESGVLCAGVDFVFAEFHTKEMFRGVPGYDADMEANVQKAIAARRPACKVVMAQLDEDPFCSAKQVAKGLSQCKPEPPLP